MHQYSTTPPWHRAWTEEMIIEVNRRLQTMERVQAEVEARLHTAIATGFRDLLQQAPTLGSAPLSDPHSSNRSPAHAVLTSSLTLTAPGSLHAPNTSVSGQDQCTSPVSAIPFFQPTIATLPQPPISADVTFGSFGSTVPTTNVLPTVMLNSVTGGTNNVALPGRSNSRTDAPAGFLPTSSPGFYGGIEPACFKHAKMDFPRFNKEDLHRWIFKAEQFFECHGILETMKVADAAMNFEGKVIRWYRWLIDQHGRPDWRTLISAMAARFGPSAYVDYNQELSKIRQTGSIEDYQERFEEFSNMVREWPIEALIGTFVGGLKEEIRIEVQGMRPLNLHDCFAITRMVEEKQQRYQSLRRGAAGVRPHEAATTNSEIQPDWTNLTKPPNRPIIRRLTPEQIREKQRQNICFHCDQPWTPGHACRRFHMYQVEEEGEDAPTETIGEQRQDEGEFAQSPEISLHALSGHEVPQLMRVEGRLHGRKVSVLVDTGSTHNFICEKSARALGCEIDQQAAFDVVVGDGSTLKCKGRCTDEKLEIQGHGFSVQLYTLAMARADLVLGIHWLKGLGEVVLDFVNMRMHFTQPDGKRLTLSATPRQLVQETATSKMLRGAAASYVLLMTSTEGRREFSNVFSVPHGLPPSRAYDHHIELHPEANAVKRRPYRYNPTHRDSLTRLVQEMLEQGIIQPSRNPFASPALLVRKKVGNWRFCVDYHALNALTVKNRYPLPIMEDLLDELRGAALFSELDLRAGYHQIQIAPQDVPKTAFLTPDGHYEFRVMSFGLTNAPATFQSLMNDIFWPYLHRFVLVFFDDILVFSADEEVHLKHLRVVLSTLRQHSLHAKLSKCSFGMSEATYLGHVIGNGSVKMEEAKVLAVRN
ncbi:uncharacterized protein LOC116265858 [Nymphaea colorata]|uniref:uncharacterized protein LOC116265858 n=1 Tax=Nymphaea colorata TaxID=210225 RepID=UPI00129D6BC5|nr:uncharacterized protein LOC116265858 [Nymphaea colorata]